MHQQPKHLLIAFSLVFLGSSNTWAVEASDNTKDTSNFESAKPASYVLLPEMEVTASADASAEGLPREFNGGQVAKGSNVGILGVRDNLNVPFSITSYTNQFMLDRNAKSVADALQSDSGVRVARGFGNFQESYFIRGFILSSDDIAYNGLYSLLPRQYIATELFERVEVLRGASTFLVGATPSGTGEGGAINLLPKRAPNDSLTRLTFGLDSKSLYQGALDIARRTGPDERLGVRLNIGWHKGETGIHRAHKNIGVGMLGLDWKGERFRLSGDIGWQDNRLKKTRPNVTPKGIDHIPHAPKARKNYAQNWSYSNERDWFGTLRGEYDFNDAVTGWLAYGHRFSKEANSLANVQLSNTQGGGTTYRFDNARRDSVDTGQLGLKMKLTTGSVKHDLVVSLDRFKADVKNGYLMDYKNQFDTNIYDPVFIQKPNWSKKVLVGNSFSNPKLQRRTRMHSLAVGDTVSLWQDRIQLLFGARDQALYYKTFEYNTHAGSKKYNKRRTSPALGFVYKATPYLSIYSNYIESLARGETAPQFSGNAPVVNAGHMLKPYVSRQKEMGVKYEQGGWGGGVALFSTKKPRAYVKDGFFSQSGKNRHQGVELTTYGEVVEGVKVLGGVTWLDAKQLKTGNEKSKGKRVIGVPRWQSNFDVEWEVPWVNGLALDSRMIYTGKRYADESNQMSAPSWTRFDVGLRYMHEVSGQVVTWRARVNNIVNKRYWSSVGGYSGSSGYLVQGDPRELSLTATIEFF